MFCAILSQIHYVPDFFLKWSKEIKSFNQEVVPGVLGLFQGSTVQYLAMKLANMTWFAWYLINLPSTGDTSKIAIKGHGVNVEPRALERCQKQMSKKRQVLGMRKSVYVCVCVVCWEST